METLLTVIAVTSIITAGAALAISCFATAIAEGSVSKQCVASSGQQPDEANTLRGTAFVTMALVETSAIYCLVIGMILIFANPFWDYAKTQYEKQIEITRQESARP